MAQTSTDVDVAALAAAVGDVHAGLAAESAWQLSEAELLQVCGSLARLRSGVESAYLRAVAEVDRRRSAAPGSDGVRGAGSGIGSSTESFLRTSAPLTPGQARSDVVAARALGPDGSLRGLEPQLACGDITRAHVDVATHCLDRIPTHLKTSDQDRQSIADYFVSLAPTRHARDLRRNATALLERLAPEVLERFDPLAHERRFFDMTTDTTGMLLGHFALDAVTGASLQAAVEAASEPLPTGDGGCDERSARQRRADALGVMAETSLACVGPRRGERPRVVVHTTAEQLADVLGAGPARTDAGTDLGPGALRRLACDAVLQRVVWDVDGSLLGSVPLDLGRESRLADVQLRRALGARDRGCIVPGCGARPSHCDAHHVVHWADGGRTCLINLVLLCGSHHTAVHAGTWRVRMGDDGIPEVVPPERVDPLRRPRRAPHHDVDELLEAMRPRASQGDGPTAATGRSEPRGAPGPAAPGGSAAAGGQATPGGSVAPGGSAAPGEPAAPGGSAAAGGQAAPERAGSAEDWLPPGWDPGEAYPF